jgi:hypothetical protein
MIIQMRLCRIQRPQPEMMLVNTAPVSAVKRTFGAVPDGFKNCRHPMPAAKRVVLIAEVYMTLAIVSVANRSGLPRPPVASGGAEDVEPVEARGTKRR